MPAIPDMSIVEWSISSAGRVSGVMLDAALLPALPDPALLDPEPELTGATALSLEQAANSTPAARPAHIIRGRLTRRE
jgi:hypothetical protein